MTISIYISIAAVIISLASFSWSIYTNRDQNKKWLQLNSPKPYLKEISFVKYKKLTYSDALSINWGYQNPLIYAEGEGSDVFYIPYFLGVTDVSKNQFFLGTNPVFTIEDLNTELERKKAQGDFLINRCFKLKFLIENRGKLPVVDLRVQVEMRLPKMDWEIAYSSDSLIVLEELQNATIILEFKLPLDYTPDQIDFRISKSWVTDGKNKQSIITGAKWTSIDGYFSYQRVDRIKNLL